MSKALTYKVGRDKHHRGTQTLAGGCVRCKIRFGQTTYCVCKMLFQLNFERDVGYSSKHVNGKRLFQVTVLPENMEELA